MMLKAVGAMGVATVLSPGMVTDLTFLPAAKRQRHGQGKGKIGKETLALLFVKTFSFLFC